MANPLGLPAQGAHGVSEVLHISPAGFGRHGVVGGAERYALELARHMAEEVSTTLLCFGGKRRREKIGKLRVEHFPAQWLVKGEAQNPFSLHILPLLLRPRVVHCHQKHILTTSIVAGARKLMFRPVFVTDLGGGGWDISAYVSTERWFTGELHISQYSLSLNPKPHPNSSVILGGVDTETFKPAPGARKNKIVFVGRILPHKGVDFLIESLPEGLELEVIGQPYDHTYLATLKDIAKHKQVRFTHGATDEYLVQAYRESLAVILPSLYEDRFGNKTKVPELLGQTLLEGMACGTPGIATRVASLPEVVDHEVSGFLVDPKSRDDLRARLQWLLANPDGVKTLGRAARERVLSLFTWPQVVSRCLTAYGF